MKFTCHNWRKIWRGVSPWDVTFATKRHVLTCPQRGKKTWIWKLLSGFGGKKFPSLTEAAVYWNCKNKKIIKYFLKIKNLEKSREIKRNPGNMLVKKLHCLLSRGTSSVLDEMGFLVFWKQMTRQKPDLEEGAACTSNAPRRAGNAFPKGRQSWSQGESTAQGDAARVSLAPPRPSSPSGTLLCCPEPGGQGGEAAWPFNAGRKHQNHFL